MMTSYTEQMNAIVEKLISRCGCVPRGLGALCDYLVIMRAKSRVDGEDEDEAIKKNRDLKAEALSERHLRTHFPKNKYCFDCMAAKDTERRKQPVDLPTTFFSKISLSLKCFLTNFSEFEKI